MPDDELEPARTPDAARLVGAVHDAGGPEITVVRRLSGGAIGAWLVRRAGGAESVMTWSPPAPFGIGTGPFDAARALMEKAAAAGVPVPRYEDVVSLGDGSRVVLQEHVRGVPPTAVSATLVDRVLALAELRRGLLDGSPLADAPGSLYLTASGPGFCHHESLRRRDDRTRDLLGRIEAIGHEDGDALDGPDLLHFDYTLGNVLVDARDPDRVVAVVDWDGARPGRLILDLVVLRFDLSWRAPELGDRLERELVDDPGFRRAWAHQSLRLVDWTIRHEPDAIVEHYVALARRHL